MAWWRWLNPFPPPTKLPEQTDAEAIASDWRAVGDDLRAAIEKAGTE